MLVWYLGLLFVVEVVWNEFRMEVWLFEMDIIGIVVFKVVERGDLVIIL